MLVRNKSDYDSYKTQVEIRNDTDSGNALSETSEDPMKDGEFSIQLGAFRLRQNAEDLTLKVTAVTGSKVELINMNDLFKVKISGLKKSEDVDRISSILIRNGIISFIIIRENSKQHNWQE